MLPNHCRFWVPWGWPRSVDGIGGDRRVRRRNQGRQTLDRCARLLSGLVPGGRDATLARGWSAPLRVDRDQARSTTSRHCVRAAVAASWANVVPNQTEMMRHRVLAASARGLRLKCVRQRCRVALSTADGRLQSFMRVRGHQFHAAQPAPGQVVQELHPERFGLAVSCRYFKYFAAPAGVDADDDHRR